VRQRTNIVRQPRYNAVVGVTPGIDRPIALIAGIVVQSQREFATALSRSHLGHSGLPGRHESCSFQFNQRDPAMKVLAHRIPIAGLFVIALALAGCGGGGGYDIPPDTVIPTTIVPPLPLAGPNTVACSNVAQDFGRLAPGEDVRDYWEGAPTDGGTARYATDLLADPANTLAVTVRAPNDGNLYGSFAGKDVVSVVIVCYPTSAGNSRLDYPLPTGLVVPHMQTGAEPPLFADPATRYPVLAFSHGYGGSPLSDDYVAALSWFASYGYIVVAPFHGDARISAIRIDNFDDAVMVLAHLRDFTALQTMRPLAMSAALDLVLDHPQWRDHINAAQIGGFGASMGGETLMLMGGAGFTVTAGLSSTRITLDPRLKAVAAYIPYFGAPFLPAFGRDQRGLDDVTLPYLAISGTADTTAPIALVEQGIARLAGPRELVSLAGVKHRLDSTSTGDIFTWSLTFLDAHARGDPSARQRLSTMASVAGGGDDRVVIPYNVTVTD
jgi:predicted dienelactone hydrolase